MNWQAARPLNVNMTDAARQTGTQAKRPRLWILLVNWQAARPLNVNMTDAARETGTQAKRARLWILLAVSYTHLDVYKRQQTFNLS